MGSHSLRCCPGVHLQLQTRVGGDKLPSIKSWKVDIPLDTAAACGTGWERAGEEVGM